MEVVHSFAGDKDDLTGTVAGNTFYFADDDEDQTWGRIGTEISYELQKNLALSATVFASTEGADPDYSGAVSLMIGF